MFEDLFQQQATKDRRRDELFGDLFMTPEPVIPEPAMSEPVASKPISIWEKVKKLPSAFLSLPSDIKQKFAPKPTKPISFLEKTKELPSAIWDTLGKVDKALETAGGIVKFLPEAMGETLGIPEAIKKVKTEGIGQLPITSIEVLAKLGDAIITAPFRLFKGIVGIASPEAAEEVMPETVKHPAAVIAKIIGKDEWIPWFRDIEIGKSYQTQQQENIAQGANPWLSGLGIMSQVIFDAIIVAGMVEGFSKGVSKIAPEDSITAEKARNIVGVKKGATPAEIKQAYRAKAHILHPDKPVTGNEALFKELNKANQTLTGIKPEVTRFQKIANELIKKRSLWSKVAEDIKITPEISVSPELLPAVVKPTPPTIVPKPSITLTPIKPKPLVKPTAKITPEAPEAPVTSVKSEVEEKPSIKKEAPTEAITVKKPIPKKLEPLAKKAAINTPGVKLLPEGIELDLTRYQKAEQFGAPSIRTGVFYLPELKSPYAKYYSTGKYGYGGGELVKGRTILRNPIIVKAGTGGKGVEKAYNIIEGKGAYQKMRSEVLENVLTDFKDRKPDYNAIDKLLKKYGGDSSLTDDIVTFSKEGNTLAYAIQEHIAAVKIREAGYDSVLSYSKAAGKPRLSEVFDLRQTEYPSESENIFEFPDFYNQATKEVTPTKPIKEIKPEIKKPPIKAELRGTPKETQERITSLISEGKSLGEIILPSQTTSAELFTRLKVDDSLSKISARTIPFTAESLNIEPSISTNFGKVVSAINNDLTPLNSLYTKTKDNVKPYLDIVEEVAGNNKVMIDIKTPDSIVGKIIRKQDEGNINYSFDNVPDVLRGRIIFPNERNMKGIVDKLGNSVFQAEDYFNTPSLLGYRGVNINLKMPNGQITELQLHTKKSIEVQEAISPIYNKWRGKDIPVEVIENSRKIADEIFAKEIKPEVKKPIQAKEIKAKIIKKKIEKKGKITKVAKSIQAKAKEKGLVKKFEGLAEYEPVVIKEQIAKIEKLMSEDIEKVKRMAIGEIALDKDVKGAMLVKMMEDYAMEQKDGDLILKLAQSPLVVETSEAGQTLRLIREREQDSATTKMQEVKKEREKVAKKKRKGKTEKQVKSDMKKDLETKIKKTKVSKYDWNNLISELLC